MINPLTFESDGDNQYLTWARDSASVTDAITAARTSSPIFQSSADIRNLSVRQGSEVVYITDFRATITNSNDIGAVTVQLMRGYISGRYFEVINEPWGSLTFSQGWGYLNISGSAWIPSNSGMTNIAKRQILDVTNWRDGINAINRNPEDRQSADGYVGASYSGILVYWDKTKTTGEVPLSLTQQHTAEISKGGSDIDPYKFKQYYIGKYYSYENKENEEQRLPITDFKFGDKRFGFLALFSAANKDVNLEWLKTEVTDYPDPVFLSTSEKYLTEYVMGPINPDACKNEVLSGYFGINSTGMVSTWNPRFEDFITVVTKGDLARIISNPQGYTKILRKNLNFGTSGITMTNNFDNGRDGGYSTYASLTNRSRTVGPVTLTAYDTGGDRQYYGKTVDPLLSDLSVTVTSVTYTTQAAANNGDPGPGIRIFAKEDSTTTLNNIAVVDVSASLPITIPIYSVVGGVESVIDTLSFSMSDNLRFVVDLDAIPSYKNNNGSVAVDWLYFAQTDTTFKSRLTSAGLSESQFFNKWLRPHIMLWFLNSFEGLQQCTIKARIASHAKRLEQQDPGVLVKVAFGRRGVWQNRPPLQ